MGLHRQTASPPNTINGPTNVGLFFSLCFAGLPARMPLMSNADFSGTTVHNYQPHGEIINFMPKTNWNNKPHSLKLLYIIEVARSLLWDFWEIYTLSDPYRSIEQQLSVNFYYHYSLDAGRAIVDFALGYSERGVPSQQEGRHSEKLLRGHSEITWMVKRNEKLFLQSCEYAQ